MFKSTTDCTEEFRRDHFKLFASEPITTSGISASQANVPGEHYFKVTRHKVTDHRTGNSAGTCLVVSFSPDQSGIAGYWVPQGGEATVPKRPEAGRSFVFTPDFSGCSLIAAKSPHSSDDLIVQHVEGGKHLAQVEKAWPKQGRSFGSVEAAMTATDYANFNAKGELTTQAFAYYSAREGVWSTYSQSREATMSPRNAGGPYLAVGSTRVTNARSVQLSIEARFEGLVSLRNRATSEEARAQASLPSVTAVVSQRRGDSATLTDIAPTLSNPFSSKVARSNVPEPRRYGR